MKKDIYHTIIDTPVGPLTLVGTERGLSGLYTARQSLPSLLGERSDEALSHAASQIEEYFRGERKEFSLDLELKGTPFQTAVWEALREIPFGTTLSYRQIAERIGRKSAVRAVGAAIGRNRIMIVIPCHRVIGANGALTGFAGGLDCKRFLLNLERPHELV